MIAAALIVLAGLAPVLGFVHFLYQGQSTVADRYMYLSMFGVALAAATWLSFAKSKGWYAAAGVVVAVLAVSAFVQVGYWKSSARLFRRCLEVDPGSPAAAYNYGLTAEKLGRDGEGARVFRDRDRVEAGLRLCAQ